MKVGGAALAAVGLVACGLVRDRGRHVQMGLWQNWGGSPTTRRLRLVGSDEPRAAARIRSRVEAVTGWPLPTQDEEREDPTDADRRYEEAVSALRERTRDHERFPLVFEENMDYGFRRNTLGIRPVGSLVSLVALAASVALLIVDDGSVASHFGRWGASALVAAVLLVFWRGFVTAGWVRHAAELYADRLFDAIHLLRSEA